MAELFGHGPRTDRAARSFNEPMCAFIDRSGDPFFAQVRHLMTGWLGHVPSEHVADLRRRLQSEDDAQFESAFWELYLHEAYLRSGYRLTIHPALAGTGHRPDFLIEGDDTRFYLEAVRACAPGGRTSTVTPTFSSGSRGELARIPITVNGWPPMKMAGWSCKFVICRLAAALPPMTATSCACTSWNWLNRVPAASFTPAAASRPGVAAVTGNERLVASGPPGSAPTAACLNGTGQ
jgi:hypothetical protein